LLKEVIMSWLEKNSETNEVAAPTAARAMVLDEAREQGLPTIKKEADAGVKPFEQVQLQPVKSPGIYEAEFGVKGADVIFHFWPSGYHVAERRGVAAPKFKQGFEATLTKVMGDVFDAKRVVVEQDIDVGALFVRAKGWGDAQFHRDLCIKACEQLHAAMGGEPG
jgi:hypothetical protein